jgi:hypothetical protein
MSDSSGPDQPEYRGSSLSFGLVLLLWGAFLYLYPPAANLPAWLQTIALILAFVCFVLGAITAGAGISDFGQNQFITHLSIAFALAVIAYGCYLVSERFVTRPEVVLAAKIAVIPVSLAAIFMFGESISQLLAGQRHRSGDQPEAIAESTSAEPYAPRVDGSARFERIAGAAIAVVSLAAAIMALVNELRRGP